MAEYVRSRGEASHHHHASKQSKSGGAKSHLPAGVPLSPRGDIGAHRDAEGHAAGNVFPGGYFTAASLPFTHDPPTNDVNAGRHGGKDHVA